MLIETYKTDHIPLSDAFGVPYPDAFSHPRIEYEMLTHAAGIIDVSHWGVLRLTGADRLSFLNAMVTHDVATLAAGMSRPALLTTTKGKIVAELLVLARADDLLVLVMQGDTNAVADALDKHIIADDVVLENLSGALAVLSSEGPRSRELVWRIFPRGALPLKPGEITENEYQGMHATLVRHTIVGDKGLHVIVARDELPRMRDYLVQGGVGIDCGPVGRIAWEMRRVENGLPWFGADVQVDGNFPKEVRLNDHVSYEKGCYLGQETIARMHYRGHPNWSLVGLAPTGAVPAAMRYDDRWEAIPDLPTLEKDAEAARADIRAMTLASAAGTELAATETEPKGAGHITSAVFSPRLKKPLFLGLVRASLAETGMALRAEFGGTSVDLNVIDLPIKGEQSDA